MKNNHIYLLVDATIALGTIQLTLRGFGIGFPIDKFHFNQLSSLTISDFDVLLAGMSVYFSSPPILISGFFEKIVTDDSEAYRGGLAISIAPYSILAVGEYEHKKSTNLKSVFVFGRLDGPLITLELAEITGVEVGFGQNYSLRPPTSKEFSIYPLLLAPANPATQTNPMEVMNDFGTFLSVQQGTTWFALGLTLDALDLLSVTAVILVAFANDGFDMSLMGLACAAFPPLTPDPRQKPVEAFVYVQLAMSATISLHGTEGSVLVAGALTPNSFILYPDCHLTGGFGLSYWFGTHPRAGDYIFTVGGYHPAFHVPNWYPVVDRVGISWNLSSVLSVRGEAYFAITPKLCMGGGRLLATFSAGPIDASFEAYTNFLLVFKKPFFIAEVGVNVSVSFNIDFWFVHIHIHADLSAELHVQGPPFGGYAYVNFHICGFTVYFGHQPGPPPALNWVDFLDIVRSLGPSNNTGSNLAIVKLSEGVVTAAGDTVDKAADARWRVHPGGVVFRVECKIPVSSLTYGDGDKSATISDDSGNSIYARQMHTTTAWSTELTVTIHPDINTAPLQAGTDEENLWNPTPIEKQMPMSVWGKCQFLKSTKFRNLSYGLIVHRLY